MSLCHCHHIREARSATSPPSTSSRSSRYVSAPGDLGSMAEGPASPSPGYLGCFHSLQVDLALPNPGYTARGSGENGRRDPWRLFVGQKGGLPGYLLSLSLHPMCMLTCAQGNGWVGEGLAPDLSVIAGDAALL